MRHTKIIATIGPASSSDAAVDALIAAGTDIFRLNFSHGTYDWHRETFARIRAAAGRACREVAILQDLSGPKIRSGRLEGGRPITLKTGDSFTIVTGDLVGGPGRVSTTFEGLAPSVNRGDRLLLADGTIELRVEGTSGGEIRASVVAGGELGQHKGINAPGVALPTSAVTIKDAADLEFGLGLGVDLVALSFVQKAADLQTARRLAVAAGVPDIPLIAKLERPQALEHLDEIFATCDGVMVARGDLGLEMPLEQVPHAQKDITRRARSRGMPVILATQVLESMTAGPRPTRAEVNDAASAVYDGVDAIMLAGETAVGGFPIKAAETLDAIIREAEKTALVEPPATAGPVASNHTQALCEAAVTLANRGDAQAIVAVTRSGVTARHLSALRPRAPIVAATDSGPLVRRLLLHWGLVPISFEIGEHVEQAALLIRQQLIDRGVVGAGSVVVVLNVSDDLTRGDANYLKIQRL